MRLSVGTRGGSESRASEWFPWESDFFSWAQTLHPDSGSTRPQDLQRNFVISKSIGRPVGDPITGRGVKLKKITAGGVRNRLRSWFPDREFFMRSHGQVRFVTVTSKMQMLAAGGALAILVVWGGSMGVMGVLQYRAQSQRAELLTREVKVASAESRVDAYRDDLDEVADDLTRRQDRS